MAKYRVTVSYTQKKEITVYARDEDEASQKAEDIVSKWNGVTDCEALDCEPEQ